MSKKIKLALTTVSLFGIALISTGCVTSGLEYKQYGNGMPTKVGYSDFQIKDNQWNVTYTGAMDSNPQLAMQYMYKRAKELCLEKGYKDFDVTNNSQLEKNNGTTNIGYGTTLSNNQPISTGTVTCK